LKKGQKTPKKVKKPQKRSKYPQKVAKRPPSGAVYIRGGANPTTKTPAKTTSTLPVTLSKREDFSNPALTPLTPLFRIS